MAMKRKKGEPAYSPGDWRLDAASGDVWAFIKGVRRTVAVTMDLRHDKTGIEQTANGHLIAQAPAMHRALLAVMAYTDALRGAWEQNNGKLTDDAGRVATGAILDRLFDRMLGAVSDALEPVTGWDTDESV